MQDDPNEKTTTRYDVSAEKAGARLDAFLAHAQTDLSRTRIKQLILADAISINGETVNEPRYKIKTDDLIEVSAPPPVDPSPLPENIPLDVIYEDDHLIVVNKPVGLVVHPAPGSTNGTLVNALLYHCGETFAGIGGVKRPGILPPNLPTMDARGR